jgi:hypothetical protein
MNTWAGHQNSATTASKLYTWWRAAYGASKIADDWAALFRVSGAKDQWDATNATATSDASVTVAGKVCANVSGWHTAAVPGSEAACKASCVNYNKDTTNGMAMTNTAGDTVLTWGTGVYLPRETTGGYWCSAFSYDSDNDTCTINRKLVSSVVTDLQPNTQTSTWGTED